MKKTLEKTYHTTLKLCRTVACLASVGVFSSFKAGRALKKAHHDGDSDSVLVLGNGPSLKEHFEHGLDYFKEHDSIAVNFFANTDEFAAIQPKYYMLLDPAFFEGPISKEERTIKLLEHLNSVSWKMTLFIPYVKSTEGIRRKLTNENVTIQLFNKVTFEGLPCVERWIWDNGLGVPSSINVLIPAVMMMMAMKYKNIYLYGADFSWMSLIAVDPQNNRAYMNDRHFYDMSSVVYFEKGRYKMNSYYNYQAFDAMDRIADYAQHRGINIVNRSQGSFIDSFPYEKPSWL